MHLHAALFDLDGTLVDSLADIAAAMNHALEHHGLPAHPVPEYRHFIGEGVAHLVRRAAPAGSEELHTSVLAAYRARYTECMLESTRPYPGIPELLQALATRGLRLAVLSNKPDPATRRLVATLFPQVPFVSVYGERPGVPRKPDPTAALSLADELGVPPAACAFIGDTPVDMGTARSAGMYAVGVTWGFRGEAELRSHGAQALAHTAEELLATLQALRPA